MTILFSQANKLIRQTSQIMFLLKADLLEQNSGTYLTLDYRGWCRLGQRRDATLLAFEDISNGSFKLAIKNGPWNGRYLASNGISGEVGAFRNAKFKWQFNADKLINQQRKQALSIQNGKYLYCADIYPQFKWVKVVDQIFELTLNIIHQVKPRYQAAKEYMHQQIVWYFGKEKRNVLAREGLCFWYTLLWETVKDNDYMMIGLLLLEEERNIDSLAIYKSSKKKIILQCEL